MCSVREEDWCEYVCKGLEEGLTSVERTVSVVTVTEQDWELIRQTEREIKEKELIREAMRVLGKRKSADKTKACRENARLSWKNRERAISKRGKRTASKVHAKSETNDSGSEAH